MKKNPKEKRPTGGGIRRFADAFSTFPNNTSGRGVPIRQEKYSLYLLGPSSKQNVRVKVASSSKNSVANASHQRLSLSCNNNDGRTCNIVYFRANRAQSPTLQPSRAHRAFDNIVVAIGKQNRQQNVTRASCYPLAIRRFSGCCYSRT